MPPKLSPYGLSPSGVGHVEAHKIANKRREKNLNAEGAKESRANAAKRNFQVALDSFVEKKLYSGANGTTYIVKVTDSFLKTLGVAMREAGHRVSGEFPAIGSRVVMKVATRKSRQAWTDFVTDNVREAAAHREIVKSDISTCIKIPCSSAFQCAGSHIPAFYLGFMNGGGASASYVTLMGYAGDMTLDEYMRTRLTTAETYANFELAACTLWASGFAHGDLHRKNAMIDPATFRCVKNRPASNARPAANRPAATDTPRNLSAMAKKIKKIPAGGLRKLLEERRAKCRAQGKEYNPTTSRCVAKKASPLAAGIKPCKQDCAALGKRCNPRTGRCIKV